MYQINPQILMFGWELPPHNSGGLGVACYGLAKGLSAKGVKIAFALPRKLGVDSPFMKILDHNLHGVEVTAINSLLTAYMDRGRYTEYLSAERVEQMRLYGGSIYDEAMRFGEMAAAWSKSQPHDVIHSHDWMTYPAGVKARYVSGKPLVAHIHATEFDRTGGNVNSQIAEIEYQGLNAADRVIAVSNYTKGIVHRHYGVDNEKIEVVHNGVDMSDFDPMDIRRLFPNDKIVLFVGRLTFQKGLEYLLQAAGKVLTYEPNTIFLVVGNGDMYERLVMEAAGRGVGHRVVFAGYQSGERLRACYQMADVFVMPSISEPYGIVALEALAAGTPAVISKQSGVSETLNHVYKVDFWDTDKMAEKIVMLLQYPAMADEMVRQARREAAEMTWERAAGKTLAVYQSLM